MSTAQDDAPMSEGLVRMILKTAGFNNPDEVRDAVKEVLVIPRVLTEVEQRKLESARKSSRDSKRRRREREREELRQKELVNENNTINT